MSRAKFDRELGLFEASADRYVRDGVLLVRAVFPTVTLAFAAPRLRPTPVVFGVDFDFTNYDAWPISVRFVNPFSGVPLLGKDLPPRAGQGGYWTSQRTGNVRNTPDGPAIETTPELVQGGPGEPPFLCIPGTREYHQHPFHTGDSWFLHRGKGVGTLQHLVEQLVMHGTETLRAYLPAFRVNAVGPTLQVHLTGLQPAADLNALPEL